MKKTILIAGVTGFIGQELARFFLEKEYRVKGLTRDPGKGQSLQNQGIEPVYWNGSSLSGEENHLEGVDVVIDLSGENIGAGRWSRQKKERILHSRLESGKALTEAFRHPGIEPGIYVQASAVGFYGDGGDLESEESTPAGRGFLAQVVEAWEKVSAEVETLGVRRLVCRFGMVLGKDRGALARMVLPFRFFCGGPLGSGQQWMSWIHIDDVARAVDFLISQPEARGVYNLTAPHPVRNREFARCLGRVLHRPSVLPAPAWILKLVLGEMAEQLLLTGQRVIPKRLSEANFIFHYPHLEEALRDLI